MGRITIDGKPVSFSTKLEIDPQSWDLKHGRFLGKSAQALGTNNKLDKIRLRMDHYYDEMLKDEGFVTAQKLKIAFLGTGVMSDTILTVFAGHNEHFKKMVDKEQHSASTYAKYDIVYRHLAEFIQLRYRPDTAFREPDFIREFDLFLRVDKDWSGLRTIRICNILCSRARVRKDYQ